MNRTAYRWRVTHPDHEPAEVIGAVKLDVVVAAAKKWGVPWSSVARACTFERIEEVADHERKENRPC